ncbi:glycerophosphodiester phosphodiesterase [Bacteriovoracaceae bacterium]|nr:glycerophosphodiester phosphodiesterase [Bacteriovoracaceae bacterium]
MIFRVIILIFLIFNSYAYSQSKFTVIAHRGASGYLPEHTLESASMAHGFDVDYIEPDVVMTKDDQLIVLHDTTLDSTTNVHRIFPKRRRKDGKFYAVDFTLKEIKSLRVGGSKKSPGKAKYPQRFPIGKNIFRIPTFEELIILVQGLNKSRGKNIGLYVEIKNPEFHEKENKKIIIETMKMLKKYGYEDNQKAILQCFYPPTLEEIKNKYKSKIPLVLLMAENSWNETSADYEFLMTEDGISKVSKYASGIGFWMNGLFGKQSKMYKSMVKIAKAKGLMVHGYTHRVDQFPATSGYSSDRELFIYFKNIVKLDGIFSDFPDVIIKYLQLSGPIKKMP